MRFPRVSRAQLLNWELRFPNKFNEVSLPFLTYLILITIIYFSRYVLIFVFDILAWPNTDTYALPIGYVWHMHWNQLKQFQMEWREKWHRYINIEWHFNFFLLIWCVCLTFANDLRSFVCMYAKHNHIDMHIASVYRTLRCVWPLFFRYTISEGMNTWIGKNNFFNLSWNEWRAWRFWYNGIGVVLL